MIFNVLPFLNPFGNGVFLDYGENISNTNSIYWRCNISYLTFRKTSPQIPRLSNRPITQKPKSTTLYTTPIHKQPMDMAKRR